MLGAAARRLKIKPMVFNSTDGNLIYTREAGQEEKPHGKKC